jgi:hypothetical protein
MSTTPVMLEPMYETDEGLEYVVNPNDYKAIQTLIDADKFRMAFHFQTVDGACIYGVTKKATWGIDMEVYTYLRKNPYTRWMILKLLTLGHFDIGVMHLGSYHVIKETDITAYTNEDNNEIILHYTYPRSKPGNVAWRSIKWDLFAQKVDEMNEEARQLVKENEKMYIQKQTTEI